MVCLCIEIRTMQWPESKMKNQISHLEANLYKEEKVFQRNLYQNFDLMTPV